MEVLIFIAVSAMMFIIAVVAIGGRQNDVQFDQAARDFESEISNLVSDVRVGYYNRPAGFSCTTLGTTDLAPVISYDSSEEPANVQGQTGDCILVGKALVMGDSGVLSASGEEGSDIIRVVDLAGVRLTSSAQSTPAETISEIKPRPLIDNFADENIYRNRYGLRVTGTYRLSSSPEELEDVLIVMNTSAESQSASTELRVGILTGSGSITDRLNTLEDNWVYGGMTEDDDSDALAPGADYKEVAICIEGPGGAPREQAAVLVSPQGSTSLVFDGSEQYCV